MIEVKPPLGPPLIFIDGRPVARRASRLRFHREAPGTAELLLEE